MTRWTTADKMAGGSGFCQDLLLILLNYRLCAIRLPIMSAACFCDPAERVSDRSAPRRRSQARRSCNLCPVPVHLVSQAFSRQNVLL